MFKVQMQEFVFSPPLLPAPDPQELMVDGPKPVFEARPSEPTQLADQLIDRCCGSHSLGLVYRFLRNAGIDEKDARAEFEQFLSGKLSEKLLDTAAQCIAGGRTAKS